MKLRRAPMVGAINHRVTAGDDGGLRKRLQDLRPSSLLNHFRLVANGTRWGCRSALCRFPNAETLLFSWKGCHSFQ